MSAQSPATPLPVSAPKRVLYAVLSLVSLAFAVERIVKGDMRGPLAIAALLGELWLAAMFFFWTAKGSPVDRGQERKPGLVLIVAVAILALAVYTLLRH